MNRQTFNYDNFVWVVGRLKYLERKVDASNSSDIVENLLIGNIFFSTHNTPTSGKLYQGETRDWVDYPKLKEIYDSSPNDFIVDNGTSFTIANHNDFIRAGSNGIGVHVDDTTAPNGLSVRYTKPRSPQPDGVGGSGNGIRFRDGNQLVDSITGDSETAPDHRNAYFGIYVDII